MRLNLFKPGGAQILIELDKPDGPYYPGDGVLVKFSILAEKNLRVERLWCGLHAWERVNTEDVDGYSTSWETVNNWVARHILRENFDLASGATTQHSLRLWVPNDAFPPALGIFITAGWDIEVHIELTQRKSDISTKIALPLVVSPPDKRQQPGQYGDSSQSELLKMELGLPRLTFLEGRQIIGSLRLQLNKPLRISQAHLELWRQECVQSPNVGGYQKVRIKQLKLGGHRNFTSGEDYTYPFIFRVPVQNCPSRQTESTTITYFLRGVLVRRFRKDLFVEAEIFLYGNEWLLGSCDNPS